MNKIYKNVEIFTEKVYNDLYRIQFKNNLKIKYIIL